MVSDILYIVKRKDETVDYRTFAVRVMAADVMDMDSVADMSIFLRTLIQGGVLKIAVDLSGLEFIDSSGIGLLIDAAKLLRRRGGDIALLNVPERIERIFQPVRLNRFIRIFNNEDEAVRFFKFI
ncbi:MAG: STAS domain-containing protein [Spirochaetes bacterium]|nr:STAS domain-containing protein [Spirochaetota bacterium]